MRQIVRKAIIPAAGLGTRFLPATKSQPKEMLPIVDKPTLQYIIEEAIESGIEEILIVTGRSKKSIEEFRKILEDGGISATVRREMGADISAACGQLRRSETKEG